MRSETSTRTFRFGLAPIATLAFSIALALGNMSLARAQSDGAAGDVASAPSAEDQPDQNGAGDSAHKAQTDAAQQAHDAADAAQDALDSATEARDQLESDGAPQDQIDAANQAIAQARAEKDAAEQAAQSSDEAVGEAQGN